MRDPLLLRGVKAVVRGIWTAEHALRRGVLRLRGRSSWRLGGACGGCAKCCEAPTIRVGRLLWYFPTPLRLFLLWQRWVNGFVLTHRDRSSRSLVFRCTHFDPVGRRCDSYDSRPFLCRDYPRALLQQPWPEFFEGCGFRPIAPDAERRRRALEQSGLSPAQRAELVRRLRLE